MHVPRCVSRCALCAHSLLPQFKLTLAMPHICAALPRCLRLLQDQWLERHAGYGRTDPGYVTSSGEADSASSLSE